MFLIHCMFPTPHHHPSTPLQMCLEGMEESGSNGLEEFIEAEKDKFFKSVDAFCISDNYWLSTKKPCITYGLRGLCYFFVEVPYT